MPETVSNTQTRVEQPKKRQSGIAEAASFLKKYFTPNFHPKHIPSRRTLLKIGGIGVGLAAAGGIGILGKRAYDYLVTEPQEFAKLSASERIKNAGLGDFVPFFEAVSDLQDSYYGKPVLSGSPADFVQGDGTDPYYILFRVGVSEGYYSDSDDTYHAQVETLRDGWGEQKVHAVELASRKVQHMQIVGKDNAVLPEDQLQQAKTAFNRFATTLPALVMMAPNQLQIFDGGGGYVPPSPDDPNGGNIELGPPSEDLQGFYVAGIHELSHAEVEWQKAKSVVDRQQYAAYIALEARNIKKVLDNYFGTPWKNAMSYIQDEYNYGPLIWYYPGDSQLTSVPYHSDNPQTPSVESAFQKKYGINVDEIAPLNQYEIAYPSLVFNRIIWVAGHEQQRIMQKQEEIRRTKKGSLTESEKAYLQDPDIAALLTRAVGEIDHYFRGPVQQYGGGFPGIHFPPLQPNSILTESNIEVQQARLQTFSTLTQSELSDFIHSSQALRNRFTIDKPPVT